MPDGSGVIGSEKPRLRIAFFWVGVGVGGGCGYVINSCVACLSRSSFPAVFTAPPALRCPKFCRAHRGNDKRKTKERTKEIASLLLFC